MAAKRTDAHEADCKQFKSNSTRVVVLLALVSVCCAFAFGFITGLPEPIQKELLAHPCRTIWILVRNDMMFEFGRIRLFLWTDQREKAEKESVTSNGSGLISEPEPPNHTGEP
jgi:hypothetical protein